MIKNNNNNNQKENRTMVRHPCLSEIWKSKNIKSMIKIMMIKNKIHEL